MRFKKIYIEITNICNLNCSFCSKDNRELRELSLQEFDKILQNIRHYTNTIYLHIKGEPLLHTKFDQILDISKKYNLNVKITTNGCLLSKHLKTLQKYTNIRQINVSLHCENNMKDYLDAGACGIGIASGIVKKKMVDENDFEGITALAKLYTSRL